MEYTIGTKVFGDWEIVREIGEGSYGKVFELHKSNFGVKTKAALKLIRIPKSVSEIKEALSEGMDEKTVTSYFEDIVQQFVKEIAIMTDLKSHLNIVSCEDYEVREHEGTIGWDILIRMELLTPMQEYMQAHTMTEEVVRKLAVDMCEALVFIQKKGLIHRDIKPGNIFVDSMGQFKLGDFGVARTAEKTMGGMSKQGTENYMAPEVYFVRPYGASVDIYSLGIVLYRLMNNNRLPFYPPAPAFIKLSDRENALKLRMEGEQLPPPCNGSEEFVSIILKACEVDPKKRYRTAGEMLAVLKGTVYSEMNDMPHDEASDLLKKEEAEGDFNISGKLNVFSSVLDSQEEDEGTFNIFRDLNGFGKKLPEHDLVEENHEEKEEKTINLFGAGFGNNIEQKDQVKAEIIDLDIAQTLKFSSDKDPRGKTIDVALEGKTIRVSVPATLVSGQTMCLNGLGRINNVTGEKGNLLLTIEIDEIVKDKTLLTDNIFREKVKQYCKEHLDDVRSNSEEFQDAMNGIWGKNAVAKLYANSNNRISTKWQTYIVPNIPLQIYSNAIFNIGENEVKKNEIIGILETTPDTRVPCGGGIIIAMDRMIIQLGETAAVTNANSKAVIYYDRFKDANVVDVKKFMMKSKAFEWTNIDGKQYHYESSMSGYVSFERIAKMLHDLSSIYQDVYKK